MYWRTGAAFLLLWTAAVALALGAVTALISAGSTGAALSFLAVAAVLCPPGQELIARWRHSLAPARAAVLMSAGLIPLGLAILGVDRVARLEVEGRQRGFSSAAQWGRAKDLGLATPQALAVHDQASAKAAREARCSAHRERPPLDCIEPEHGKAAVAFAEARLARMDLPAEMRSALARQRKSFLAVDKECAQLLDRIEEVALPEMIANRAAAVEMVASIWARHLSRMELQQSVARAGSAGTPTAAKDMQEIDRRMATAAPAVEKELDSALQIWARRIVLSEPSWRSFVRGRTPLVECKPAKAAEAAHASR